MSRIAGSRWLICVAGIAVSACAVVGAMWHYGRPASSNLPPLPDIQVPQEEEQQTAPADPSLPESEREFLWEVEHHGNLLNAHGFAKIADALRDANASAITAALADDFDGGLLQQPKETRLKDECVDVLRREDSGATPQHAGRSEFIDHLLELRKLFTSQPPKVQLQAPNIVHFGLGESDRVERLTIRWPSGKVQELRDVRADRHIVVDEDKEEAAVAETAMFRR